MRQSVLYSLPESPKLVSTFSIRSIFKIKEIADADVPSIGEERKRSKVFRRRGNGRYLIISQLSASASCALFLVIKVANRIARSPLRSQKFPSSPRAFDFSYRLTCANEISRYINVARALLLLLLLLPFICIKRRVLENDLIRVSRPNAGTNALLPLLLTYSSARA